MLANAPIPAFAIAAAGWARFIRVNEGANACVAHAGFIEGRAGEPLRFRAKLRQDGIRVFADSHVKHGAHAIAADRSIEEPTRDLALFDADAGIATGQRTGDAARPDEIRTIRDTPHLPLPVGSGVSEADIGEILALTDGVFIASSLKVGGVWWIPVDPARVRSFVARAAERRSTLLAGLRCRISRPIGGTGFVATLPAFRTGRALRSAPTWTRCPRPRRTGLPMPRRSPGGRMPAAMRATWS